MTRACAAAGLGCDLFVPCAPAPMGRVDHAHSCAVHGRYLRLDVDPRTHAVEGTQLGRPPRS